MASNIFEEKNNNQLNNGSFAVLYRTNAQSRSIEDALRKINIDYQVFGGLSFYQRKEIKDIMNTILQAHIKKYITTEQK